MAPNLSPSKRQLIWDMIESNLKTTDIANAAECSKQSFRYNCSNLRMWHVLAATFFSAKCDIDI